MVLAALQLLGTSLFPALATIGFFFLEKRTKFSKWHYWWKQGMYGFAFGLLAIAAGELGVVINGAPANCRDALVVATGLIFGGPSGVIAGIISGGERALSVLWGASQTTQIASSVSTVVAGFYVWGVRRYMLENRRPELFFSFLVSFVTSILHLTLIFLTNLSDPNMATKVVRASTIPLILANGFGVVAAVLTMTLLSRAGFTTKKEKTPISTTVQRWLLLAVAICFITTSAFVYGYQTSMANYLTNQELTLALSDTEADIRDCSDANMIDLAERVAKAVPSLGLETTQANFNVSEINLVNQSGVIYESTNADYVGFDMHSGEQSAAFLCLLDGTTTSYVQAYGPITFNPSVSRKYAGIVYGDGFLQIGYDAAYFQKDIDAQIQGITKNRRVGTGGFIIILDEERNIVSAPSQFEGIEKSETTTDAKEGEVFSVNILDTDYYGKYQMCESYYLVAAISQEEALSTRNVALYVNTFMEVLVFAIFFAMVYALIKIVIVKRLNRINHSLTQIASGNLDEVVTVRDNAEFVLLSNDINVTVRALKHYIEEANCRIDAELEFAKQIQTSAMPTVNEAMQKRPEFDIFASTDPAKEVGGDFYDFYFNNDYSFNFLIADVSGKGIPAAMFMMRAKADLKSYTEAGYPLSRVFTDGNAALCEGNDAGMFVTAWQAQIDLENGKLTYANAGHNPPLIRKASTGRFEYLKGRAGFIMAGMDGFVYKTTEMQLEPGDIVFLYTDGVTEAVNPEMKLYGEERLLSFLNGASYQSMQELCSLVRKDIDVFANGAAQADDITMLAFRYYGPKPIPTLHFDHAKLADIEAMTSFLEEQLEKTPCSPKARIQLDVALDEIVSNIINHGYRGKEGPITIRVDYREEWNLVYVKFIDEAKPYNPLTNADPDVDAPLEERKVGGLGIYMVRQTMDDMKYKYENGTNILTLAKILSKK